MNLRYVRNCKSSPATFPSLEAEWCYFEVVRGSVRFYRFTVFHSVLSLARSHILLRNVETHPGFLFGKHPSNNYTRLSVAFHFIRQPWVNFDYHVVVLLIGTEEVPVCQNAAYRLNAF